MWITNFSVDKKPARLISITVCTHSCERIHAILSYNKKLYENNILTMHFYKKHAIWSTAPICILNVYVKAN